jgi:hypothetical protein
MPAPQSQLPETPPFAPVAAPALGYVRVPSQSSQRGLVAESPSTSARAMQPLLSLGVGHSLPARGSADSLSRPLGFPRAATTPQPQTQLPGKDLSYDSVTEEGSRPRSPESVRSNSSAQLQSEVVALRQALAKESDRLLALQQQLTEARKQMEDEEEPPLSDDDDEDVLPSKWRMPNRFVPTVRPERACRPLRWRSVACLPPHARTLRCTAPWHCWLSDAYAQSSGKMKFVPAGRKDLPAWYVPPEDDDEEPME